MAVKKLNLSRQWSEWRKTLFGSGAWRLRGAVLVAALGIVALGVLAASRPAAPVETAAAMEPVAEPAAAAAAPAPKKPVRPRKKTAPVSADSAAPAPPQRAVAAASAAPAAIADDESAVVTISGCLEQDDDVFRLKDTEGSNAPKTRSWKSGFLRKRSATLDVVDASNRLRLRNLVGQRVSITGLLYDRELLANTVKRIGSSCEE